MIEWRKTERGFERGEFKDHYGEDCSIQQSSLATEDAIWLGRNVEVSDKAAGARMHLTREMAGELAQILLRFSYTGELR